RSVNVEPLFRPALCAVIVPLCASTSALLMARPSPSPPSCVRPPCSKASKIFGSSSDSIPKPVSAIFTRHSPLEVLLVEMEICPSLGVNFLALLLRFHQL